MGTVGTASKNFPWLKKRRDKVVKKVGFEKKMGRSIPEILKNGKRPRGKSQGVRGEGEGDDEVGDRTSSWDSLKGSKGKRRNRNSAELTKRVPHA